MKQLSFIILLILLHLSSILAMEKTTPSSSSLVPRKSSISPSHVRHGSDETGATPRATVDSGDEETPQPQLYHNSDEDVKTETKRDFRYSSSFNKQRQKSRHRRNYWPNAIPHTGSMTPYKFFALKNPKFKYVGCKPIRIWSLFRHSIRYPGKETAHGMRTRLKNLQESIILKHYELKQQGFKNGDTIYSKLLTSWKLVKELVENIIPVSNEKLNEKKKKKKKEVTKNKKGEDEIIENAKALTPRGMKEAFNIGNSYLKKFGNVFEKAKEKSSILIKFTDCQRTRATAKQLYTAIYGEPKDDQWHAPVDTGDEGKDPLLKYDALCGHWKKNYKKSDLNAYHLDSFANGKDVTKAIDRMIESLHFPEKSLTLSDAKLLYEACAFEVAWSKRSGAEKRVPWCHIMVPKYQAVFEYLEDYEFFKNDGPDNKINKMVGCFLFKDMIKRLIGDVRKDDHGGIIYDLQDDDTKIYEDKTSKIVTIYVAHLTAVLKFITHLGLYADKEPLRADNFKDMKQRLWKTSHIGSFSTNITFVLMECLDTYSIVVLHQERPVILPGCPSELCPIDVFLGLFKESIFNCSYENICKAYKNPFFSRSEKPMKMQSIPTSSTPAS